LAGGGSERFKNIHQKKLPERRGDAEEKFKPAVFE
jgi:hypothetical protein